MMAARSSTERSRWAPGKTFRKWLNIMQEISGPFSYRLDPLYLISDILRRSERMRSFILASVCALGREGKLLAEELPIPEA
jgi:hypothetical protein